MAGRDTKGDRHDPDHPVPRAHRRAQQDRALGALVQPPRGAAVRAERQGRVLRGAQLGRRLRHLARCSSTGSAGATPRRSSRGMLVRDVRACRSGRRSTPCWCDDRGFVDAGRRRVPHTAPDEYLLTSAAAQPRWFADLGSGGCDVRSRTSATTTAMLALQGPRSRELLARARPRGRGPPVLRRTVPAKIAGAAVTVSRTGYTGDLGYELLGRRGRRARRPGRGARGRAGATASGRSARTPCMMLRIEAGLAADRRRVRSTPATPGTTPTGSRPRSSAGAGCSRGAARPTTAPSSARRAIRARAGGAAPRAGPLRGIVVDWRRLRPPLSRRRPAPAQVEHPPALTESMVYDDDGRAGRLLRRASCTRPVLQRHIGHRPGAARTSRRRAPECSSSSRSTTAARQVRGRRSPRLPFFDPERKDGDDEQRRDHPRHRTYDAIVVGGGHNGLVNGAYLAKAGLRTLVLERRHLVGGAAITEELRPGLLVHDVLLRPQPAAARDRPRARPGQARLHAADDAVRRSTRPGRRLPAARRRPRAEPPGDPPALAARRRRLRRSTTTTWTGSARRCGRCFDNPPPNIFGNDPEDEARRGVAAATTSAASSSRCMHDVVRLLTGSAADCARRLLRARGAQGLPRLLEHHRLQGRADVAGLRPGAALPQAGRARRPPRLVGVPQGRQRRLHPGAGARRRGVRRRDPARRRRSTSVITKDGRAVGRRARRRHRVLRAPVVVSRARPAAYVPRAGRPARAARTTSSTTCERMRFRGVVGQGELRPRRAAEPSRAADTRRPLRRLHQHRTDHRVRRARLRRGQVRLVLRAALHRRARSSRVVDPDMAPPGKHVMSCFVQYAPYELRGSDWETEREQLRRHGAGACSSRSSRASATWCCSARS